MRKSQKWYFRKKNPWSYRSKSWYAYTTSLCESHGLGSTWPHLLLFLCKAKYAKNDISAKTLEPKELDHELIYIWNQYNLGNVLSTCI